MTNLAELTWPEVDPACLLVIPLGSTEQHGPHLPLSTDTDIAVRLATSLADLRSDVLVAPALAYGASGEHAGFPGTLSLGQTALEIVLVELVRSADLTARRVLLLNGHGGNVGALHRAVAVLSAEGREVRAWGPTWPGDAHAGRTETSAQLAIGARVGPARPVGVTTALRELLPVLQRDGVRAVSANGVLGDASGASAEEGRVLLDSALDDLVTFVESW